ncbi:hypothetical protein RHSIM_Rhsim07G0031500 [Rhododendron simsii]|uniref:Glycosyltransferase n=1 Tax=Rhododendron simsii TaxID=118357 RepID=A0A834LIQ9_RHOSS|nr:hypothetical protein RHSIM_Rhsim07G0031500 [Rhododendron simsii]
MAGVRRDGSLMREKGGHSFRGSRIAAAVAIGVLLGCVCAFAFPNGFFSPAPSMRNRRLSKSDLESLENVPVSEARVVEKNAELKKQVRELTEKLRLVEQGKGHTQEQYVVSGEQTKAGPFGTVKSLRTLPTVLADESVNPRLAKLLKKVAVRKELIVALANSNVQSMLEVWYTSIKKVGIPNYLVVALDDGIANFCQSNSVPFYKRDPNEGIDSIAKTGTNHAVSGLKFRILREFLQLGYSILLSDVDIVYLQNPFDHLRRDSDVESMSDGHNNMTAYGYNDVFDEPAMGWARYAHTMRIWVYNSGFFYIRPTIPSIELLDRVAERLSRPPPAWDQAVFNEELFFPSHPGYIGLHAAKRTLDMYLFMNSKVLFKTVRKDANLKKLMPVIVHVNYHPDKLPRMKAVVEFYVNGKKDALDPFPDGIPTSKEEAKKAELKPLRSLLSDTVQEKGNDEISRKCEGKEPMEKTAVSDSSASVRTNVKKRDEKRNKSNRTKVTHVTELHSPDSQETCEDNLWQNVAKGKSSRWKSKGTFPADDEESAFTSQTNETNYVHVNKLKTPPNIAVMVDKNIEESEKQQSPLKTRVFNASENYFGQKDTSPTSTGYRNIDDLFQENFVVEELYDDPETGDILDDIKISEAKIRKWLNGKEGNIRSVLSTLQYLETEFRAWKYDGFRIIVVE